MDVRRLIKRSMIEKEGIEMYCSVCGKEIADGAVICTGCGCKVETSANPGFVETKKKSYAPLILGIVGIVFAWILAIIGHAVSITGIVLGAKEYKETGKMAGLVVSIIGEVCSVLSSIIGAVAMVAGL